MVIGLLRIANSSLAVFATNRMSKTNRLEKKSLERLSSGYRINGASDDAAGLAISERMRAQLKGLIMAARNAGDGVSLVQTAEGALNGNHSILQRIRELTVQAASDTYTSADRQHISREVTRLIEELDRTLTNTEFNRKKVFLGLDDEPITFHIGANANQSIELFIKKSLLPSYGYFVWEAGGLITGLPGDDVVVDLSNSEKANIFLDVVDKAIADLSAERANLGAIQNRLSHTIANLHVAANNLQAAESRIRDTDMAQEMAQFTKHQIIHQASIAMLAQANQQSGNVLQLLQ